MSVNFRYSALLSANVVSILFTAALSAPPLPAAPPDYPKIMQSAFKRSLGADFRKYEWLSYPTNNFGIATMYVLENEKAKPGDRNQWCATFTCLGMEGNRLPKDPNDRLTVNGYADVGTGGPIMMSNDENRVLAADVFLPGMMNILGLSDHLASSRSTRVSLRIGNASRRILKKQAILTYLDKLPATSPVHKALNDNRLAMVVADAVVDSLELDIDTRGTQSADLNSKLLHLIDHVMGVPGTMMVQVKRDKSGQFRLVVNQPVIVARLIVRRPLAGRDVGPRNQDAQLPTGLNEWETWVPAETTGDAR